MHRCNDLRQLAVDQLENLAIDCAKEEFGYRFGSHDDAKAKVGLRGSLRRQIARIATVIAEKQRSAAIENTAASGKIVAAAKTVAAAK